MSAEQARTTLTDRNVYILGAGFSKDAGAPLVHDFLDASRRLLDQPFSGLDELEMVDFQNVFRFRREMAQAREKVRVDLDDIEQLFGLVEASQRWEGGDRSIRDSTVYMIAKTLQAEIEQRWGHRTAINLPFKSAISQHPSVLAKFGITQGADLQWVDEYGYFLALACGIFDNPKLRKWRKDTIITFNYDLICDHALRRLGYEADYHLSPGAVDDCRTAPGENRLDLLKLHGSTNWGICSGCSQRILIVAEKVTDSPSEFRQLKCSCGRGGYQPFLIPPSWDKSEYRELIAPVWKKALEELKLATRICVIGYSMPETDTFYKFLLTMALSRNYQLYKFVVVDRRPEVRVVEAPLMRPGLEERYLELFDPMFRERRFSFFGEGFYRFLLDPRSRSELGRGELLDDRS
jgi:hypothetical protein